MVPLALAPSFQAERLGRRRPGRVGGQLGLRQRECRGEQGQDQQSDR